MEWVGSRIKILSKEKGIPLTRIAKDLQVSRQTMNDWIKGQVPKGTHLIGLCKIFNVSPDYFFQEESVTPISIPLHRTRGRAKLNTTMEHNAMILAKEYEGLFRFASSPGLVPVLRGGEDMETARSLAQTLRTMVRVEANKPMDYEKAFTLLAKLNIVCIFRAFPVHIKGYAFYCRIHRHRVIFVNTATSVLDLIFALLHETVHAVRDEDGSVVYDREEESFCDMAAGLTQYQEAYVEMVFNAIKDKPGGQQVNILKKYSGTYCHSIYGICSQIESRHTEFNLKTGGADTNLKKDFLTIGEILFESKEPAAYITNLKELSPLFFDIVSKQIDNPSTRKFGELLGLESSLDAQQVRTAWRELLEHSASRHAYTM